MDIAKRQRLEKAGWQVGDTEDFLQLSPEEIAFIDLKLTLSQRLKELRLQRNLSPEKLAQKLQSSEANIARIEAGDPSISLDLIVRTMLSLGATTKDIFVAAIDEK
ncbi:MAG: helix-turn-helix transcriptional regulator [Cyanobacteria bacterium SBLK]|nr:helix-turn-helix transcriptional regulator [Cyanobacteria bacterium SBLK]